MSLQTYKLPLKFALGTGKKILDLPVGQKSAHYLRLNADFDSGPVVVPTLAQWATYLKAFRIIINDVPLPWQDTQTYIDLVMTRHGQTAKDGLLPLYFARPWEDDFEQRSHFALGTQNIGKLQIELDFIMAPNFLNAYVELGANAKIGKVYYIRNRNITDIVNASVANIDDVPSGRNYESLGFHYQTSATIAEITPWFGDNKLTESHKILREQQDLETGRAGIAGYTHLDISKRGTIYEGLLMHSPDFVLETEFTSAPGAFVLAQECVQDFNVTHKGGVPMVLA